MSHKTLSFTISNSQSRVQLVDDPSEPGWEDFFTRRQSEDGPKDETEYVTVQSSGEQDWREGRGRCYEGTTEGVGGNSEGAGCWRTAAWQALRR